MKNLLLIVLMTVGLTADCQITNPPQDSIVVYESRGGDQYFVYSTDTADLLKVFVNDIAWKVDGLGYKYFSVVKSNKKSYQLGSFPDLKSDIFRIVLHNEAPPHKHWMVWFDQNLLEPTR